MLVSALIGVMIAIVVGVNLLPTVLKTVANITEEAPASVSALIGVLPYIFVVVITLGAVAWMGSGSSEQKEERKEQFKAFFKNPRDVILRIEKSSKNWSRYLNNLDSLLGIKTINDIYAGSEYGLSLNEDRELYIHPGYDWYVADKYPDKDIFKVVGLHKEDANLNHVYLLGIDEGKNKPFLVEIPAEKYLEADCKSCYDGSLVRTQ